MPFDVSIDCMFEQLGDIIYSRTTIDKQMFKLVLNCKYHLKSGNMFQHFLIWDDSSVYRMLNLLNTIGMEEIESYIEVVRVKPQVNQFVCAYTDLLVRENDNVIEFDYVCGPSSDPAPDIDRCGVYGDVKDCEDEETNDEFYEDVDDESNGDLDVQANGHVSSFHTINQVLKNEQGIYVSTHVASCDLSNNPNAEEPNESFPVHYHLPPSPQFEHVENFGNVIWTSWVKHTTGNSSGEFVVGQVFNSNSALQEAAKIYLIKAHQEFLVVASSKKLLVLRCKKTEECKCSWKLHAILVEDTCLFVINKYKGSHTYVNPCLNRNHHQLDSNLVVAHIKAIIKA